MNVEHFVEPSALKQLSTVAIAFAMALSTQTGAAEDGNESAKSVPRGPKIWAVQINVTDLDEAIDFYTNTLGLQVAAREYYPVVVSLKNDGAHVLLYHVDKPTETEFRTSLTSVNWQVPDLDEMRAKFIAQKVRGLTEIEEFPLGRFFGASDPTGNHMDIVELDEKFGSVDEARLFNVEIPIANKDKAMEFYEQLGFESYPDNYWPPVVPLAGEGMEFILHQSDETAVQDYPNKPGAFVILTVEDIYARVKELEARGMTFLYDKPQTHSPVGIFTALRDPFGNVVELIQPVRTPFDEARERAQKDVELESSQ